MRRIRALLAAAVTVCGLLWSGGGARGADGAGVEIASPADTIRTGQEIELTFSLEGYTEIKSGVNALKGTLEYDSTVFKEASQENFETVKSWEKLFYNPENGQFVLINRGGSTQEEEVFRLRLTAGESIAAGETSVTVKDVSVSEGKEDMLPADFTLRLSAVSEYPGADDEHAEETDDKNAGSEEKKGNVRAGDTPGIFLPAAGVLIGSAILIGAVIFWRRKKKLSGRAKILTGVAACVGAAALVTGSVYAFGGKGDLNGDGSRDYTDVELLEKHLIGLELLPGSRQGKADMNSDGALTVTDLSLLIRRIEKTVDYDAELSSAMEQFHYEKGEPVDLKFLADVSHGTRVRSVTVNGEEHQAEPEENGSVYTVRTEAGDTAGVKEFRFSEVLLEGGQTVKADHTEKIGVLKDMPEVEGFLAEELTDTAKMKVSFTLKDEDSAVVSAAMEVANESDGTTLVSEEVKAGENEFVLDLEEDTEYAVNITASYDRASGELPSGENHGGSFAVTKKVELNLDYRFAFGGLKAVTEDGTRTERFGRNQPVVLLFESSNATGFAPERAVVNGKTYSVTRTEQGFAVTLDGFDSTGIKTVTAEQIVLENGKAFDLAEDNEITLQILKEIPQVKDLMVEEDAENSQFRVAFQLTDPDGALSDCKVLIRNGEGKTVGGQSFTESDLADGKYDAGISLTDTGLTHSYTVQVIADRDLTENGTEPEPERILAAETVKAKLRVLITDGHAGSVYAEKGETADLFYEISHNADGNLSALVVDQLEVKPEQQPDGMWKVSVPVPDQAGIHDFALSQAAFDDGTQAHAEHRIKVEVLKDAPSAESFAWNKTAQDELSIRFELKDEDSALQDARV